MSEYEQRTITRRRDGGAMVQAYRMGWEELELRKANLEERIARLEEEHYLVVGEMKALAQEARSNGVTLSRQAWVKQPLDR